MLIQDIKDVTDSILYPFPYTGDEDSDFKFTEYVVGFALTPDDKKLVLIEKLKPSWQAGKLNGVGGKVEPTDSNVFEAMVREFREETGIYTESDNWTRCVVLTGDDFIVHFFVMRSVNVIFCRTTEKEKVCFVNPKELPDNVIPNLRWLVPLCTARDIVFPVFVEDKPTRS